MTDSQTTAQERAVTQIQGEIAGYESELSTLDLQLSQLQQTRDRLSAELAASQALLEHIRKAET
jgi:septal ring factor EnvC (AmiA/AmiB activator)